MALLLPVMRALADPTRLRIVLLVRQIELAVGELADVLGQSQPRVSRHLKILADAGLLHRAKEGAWVFVRLAATDQVASVLALLDAYDADATADLARLADVRAERAAAATAYFAAHADAWDGIRSLHAPDCDVEAAIVDMIGPYTVGRLLDVGTGTGRMIELLGPHAASAIGVDRSPEMLRLARGKIEAAGLAHAEVRRADMYALPRPDQSADTVVLHQVLHFADAPAAAIAESARVVAPGGRLLVVDFAPHDREELRARHAHTRLGFDDAQIGGWLRGAGLDVVASRQVTNADFPLAVSLWLGARQSVAERAAA